jgi:translocator protein
MIDLENVFFLLLPSLTGYIASFNCKVGHNAGEKILARPPSWVFGVVWPILYLLLGVVWLILRNNNNKQTIDILMSLNLLLLVSWIVVYGCMNKKRIALYILLGILVVGLMIFGDAWSQNKIAGILVTPFIAWIIFATMLNYTEVNQN